jgi:hypothetical protein
MTVHTLNTWKQILSTFFDIYIGICCAKFFNWEYETCTGNHPNDCVAELYYPDWEGGSGSCINDGNEPSYMNTNSHAFLFNTRQGCCQQFYSWDYNNCVGIVETKSSLYYPDWTDSSHVCKNDRKQPTYMNTNPHLWMHDTLESCCKQNYGWNYNNCMREEAPPNPVANAKYYMIWGSPGGCFADCDVGDGPDCGGRANFWDELFDTRTTCCKEKNWWNQDCDK